MAQTTMVATGDWLLLVMRVACRWLLSRNGHLLLAVTFVGVLVVWVNLHISDNLLDRSAASTLDEGMYPYFADDDADAAPAQPLRLSPAEMEHRRRVAVFSRILQKQVKRRRRVGVEEEQTRCIHPKLSLKHDANRFAYYDLPPLNCTGSGMFVAHRGALMLNRSVLRFPSVLGRCSFYGIERMTDNMYSYSKPEVLESPPFVVKNLEQDFVRISCLLKSTLEEIQRRAVEENKTDGNSQADDRGAVSNENPGNGRQNDDKDQGSDADGKDEEEESKKKLGGDDENNEPQNGPVDSGEIFEDSYDDWRGDLYDEDAVNPDLEDSDCDQFLVRIRPKPEVFERIAKIEAASPRRPLQLNVLMFALDSMSHLCYQRKMPRTYKYLRDELGAAILENYNIVGDATTAAIIPMLTGRFLLSTSCLLAWLVLFRGHPRPTGILLLLLLFVCLFHC